jgi:hypothetical protein
MNKRYVVEVELDGVTTNTEQETWDEAVQLVGDLCKEFPTANISIIDNEKEV